MRSSYIFAAQVFETEKRALKRFITASAVLHILIAVSIVVVGSYLNLAPKIQFEAVEARLVKFGEKPREKKLLPRIVKKEAVAAKTGKANTITKEADKKKEPDQKKEEPKKATNLDSLLGSALEDIKKDARAEETKEGTQDGDKDGDVTDPALALKGDLYIRQISALIKKNWKIPSIITNDMLAALKAEIYFRITPAGEIYDIQVVTPSDNRNYDSSVLEAVKVTARLPLPEDKKLKKYVLTEGLQWGFTSGAL